MILQGETRYVILWRAHFAREPFPYPEKQHRADIHPPAPPEPGITFHTDLASHVVNNAMAIKQPALWYRLSGDLADRDAIEHILATLDRYHGQATGVFTGDEHLAGTHPTTDWNVALLLDPDHPEPSLRLVRRPLSATPFSPEGAPIELHALARRVRNWGIAHGAAEPPPIEPEVGTDAPHSVVLIPYGCTNLRVTEIPRVFE